MQEYKVNFSCCSAFAGVLCPVLGSPAQGKKDTDLLEQVQLRAM